MTPLALVPAGPTRDRLYVDLRNARGGNHGFVLWHAQDVWTDESDLGLDRNWGHATVVAVGLALLSAAGLLGALLSVRKSDAV